MGILGHVPGSEFLEPAEIPRDAAVVLIDADVPAEPAREEDRVRETGKTAGEGEAGGAELDGVNAVGQSFCEQPLDHAHTDALGCQLLGRVVGNTDLATCADEHHIQLVGCILVEDVAAAQHAFSAAEALAFTVVLVGILVVRWVRQRPGWREIGVALGIALAYGMVFLRMDNPAERTHLIEYGIVAALIHQALLEKRH